MDHELDLTSFVSTDSGPVVESMTIVNASDVWDKSHTNVLNDTILQINLSEPVVNMSSAAFRSA